MNIRCPRCSTLFNASDEVVEAGHGLVRCSRCRNVFKAADHRENPDRFGRLPAWIRGELLSQIGDGKGNGARIRLAAQILATALLGIVLGAQIAYSQMEHLGQSKLLRPVLGRLCQITRCQLAPLRQLDMLRLADSQISWRKNQMIDLKLSILNEAEFEQPCPVVHVTMSNYLNQIVAEGRFRPDQYASNKTVMAVQETVMVELLIDNPGHRIRSYEISFF